MKAFKSLFCILFLAVSSLNLASVTFGQYNSLPDELTKKSSLEEILTWLDKTSFSKAHIGLISEMPTPAADEIPTSATRYSEDAFFSKGFKLVKIDGCRLTLRNDNIQIDRFVSANPDIRNGSLANFRKAENGRTKFAGDLIISLERLGKKGKSPFQQTEKAEKAKLLGLWRTEFKGSDKISVTKFNKWRVPNQTTTILKDFELKITGLDAGSDEFMDADKLTFTFDDKETSEKFYAAFRQAINLCSLD